MAELFILAGEASGDRIGANLISGLQDRLPDLRVTGVGGEAMQVHGLQSIFSMDDLAVMGYRDVILRLPLLLWRARQVREYILRHRPHAVVLIDAQVFSEVVAKGLRKRGFDRPILLYVAPAVWAWGAKRAKILSRLYDEVLSVLPFEPQAMRGLGGPLTVYVGHPAVQQYPMRTNQPSKGPLLLLPGSRRSEFRKHLPLYRALADRLGAHPAVTEFVILSTRGQSRFISEQVSDWPRVPRVIDAPDERQQSMNAAVAAIAVSGTVTLELALAGVPHVLTYVAEQAQVRLFKRATTRYIGLPNILADREVVPEVLFAGKGDAKRLWPPIVALLNRAEERMTQVEHFAAIRDVMEKGAPEAPLEDPVERVLEYLDPHRLDG